MLAVALAAISIAVMSRPAAADPNEKYRVGVDAGAALPLGDDSNILDLGVYTGLVWHYRFQSHFAAGARLGYQMERGSPDYKQTVQSGQIEATTYLYGAEAEWLPMGSAAGLSPSVILGVDYYTLRLGIRGGVNASSSDQAMGGNIGGGIGYTTKAGTRLEALAQYHRVSTSTAKTFATFGLRLTAGLGSP